EYLEVQLHGPLRLDVDVDCLVCDPAFRSSSVGLPLTRLAERYGFTLRFNSGFKLEFNGIPADFRGPLMPPLPRRLEKEYSRGLRRLDISIIGDAAQSVVRTPERWADWGVTKDALQHLKQLWHTLVQFGKTD